MDLDRARKDLVAALYAGQAEPAANRVRDGRRVLFACGTEALGIAASPGLGLGGLIAAAATSPATPERRAFAVLLVHALGITGLVRPNAARHAKLERDICRFAETAIASVLLRSGYPFSAGTYDKIGFLERLHMSIDEHLRPFEPTFPPWLNGLDQR